MRGRGPKLVVAAVFLAAGVPSAAGMPAEGAARGTTGESFAPPPRAATPSIDARLATVAAVERARGEAAALDRAAEGGLLVDGNRVVTIVEASSRNAARDAVAAAGGVVTGEHAGLLEVAIPVDALERVAGSRGVSLLRPPALAQPLAVNGEGTAAIGAPAWHAAGYTGDGVKVAVVDLGFGGTPPPRRAATCPPASSP